MIASLLILVVGAEGAQSMTLRQTLDRAFARHPVIEQSVLLSRVRGAGVRASGAAYDTDFVAQLGGQYVRVGADSTVDGAIGTFGLTGSLAYAHHIPFGTTFQVGLDHGVNDTSALVPGLDPSFQTNLTLGVTQPLLKGAGSRVGRAPIEEAEALYRSSGQDLKRTAELVAADIAIGYWALAQAEEEVEIRKRGVDRAKQLLDFTNKLIERGSLPKAAAAQAESTVSLRLARLYASERGREQAENTLLNAMLVPEVTGLKASDRAPTPGPLKTPMKSTETRADLKSLEYQVQAAEQAEIAASELARPELNLSASGALHGLGGSPGEGCTGPAVALAGCKVNGDFDGGFPTSFSTLFTGGFFTIGLVATLVLPVINDAAEGSAEVATLSLERAKEALNERTRLQKNEEDLLGKLASRDRASYEVSKQALDLAVKLLDVEQKRYELGAATTFDVLRVQDDLSEAEILEAQARAGVSITDLRAALAAGRLLETLGLKAPESAAASP